MGAWDATSFGNDTANDWAYGLEKSHDLSYIDSTLQRILDAGDDYIEGPDAEEAIAAAEVLAWLLGRPTPVNAYTRKVAEWVAAHPIRPTAALIEKALAALDRIKGESSELPELWKDSASSAGWAASMSDLRARLTTLPAS